MPRKTMVAVSCAVVVAVGMMFGPNVDAEPQFLYTTSTPENFLGLMFAELSDAMEVANEQAEVFDALIEVQKLYVAELQELFDKSGSRFQWHVLTQAEADLTQFETRREALQVEIERLAGIIEKITEQIEQPEQGGLDDVIESQEETGLIEFDEPIGGPQSIE